MAAAVRLDQTRLAAARLRASGIQPFLAVALYAMTPVASEGLGTFAVDERGRLLIDPVKLAEWPVPQVAGVLLHEVGHVLRDHASRARAIGATGPLERRVWNVAGDAEINDDLLEAGVELPAGLVTPQALELPAHRAAEFYYAALTDRGHLPEYELDCGPGSDGTPWGGQERPLPPGLPQVLPPGLAPHEVVLLRQKVAAEIARRGSARPGSVPGGWQRWAQATLHPQLDWRRLLAARVRSCTAAVSGASDYSYSRPPRRRVPGVVLPAMQRPLPRVAVIVDTSGSVSGDLLSLAWTEVHGCLRHLSVRRDLLAVYAADAAVRRLPGLPRRTATLTGGGGTDMAAAIGVAVSARPAPDLVIVITDGLTPWPPARPGRDVVVALLPLPDDGATAGFTSKARSLVPAWAHVVEVRPLPKRYSRRQRRRLMPLTKLDCR